MKCPYRPIIIATKNSTTTEFAECYGKECPWYVSESAINNGKIIHEDCQRCHTENTQANNERERYRR